MHKVKLAFLGFWKSFGTFSNWNLENDEGCSAGEIEVDGLCVEESYASEFANLLAEADNDQPENNSMQMRRFPLPGSSVDASDNLRTKKRTQRISLLMAQVDAKQRADPKQPKLRPREFLQKINGYGKFDVL